MTIFEYEKPTLVPSDGVIRCYYCGRTISIRNDGRLRKHGTPTCPSSGTNTGSPAPR